MKKSASPFIIFFTIVGCVIAGNIMIFLGGTALSAPDGAALYANHCGACHPQGGTPMAPSLPVVGSSKMKSLAVFTEFSRNPVKSDGSKGIMPPFPKTAISDQEMKLIYEYSLTLPVPKK
jgi:mono/diheme cytochrome c family protein